MDVFEDYKISGGIKGAFQFLILMKHIYAH